MLALLCYKLISVLWISLCIKKYSNKSLLNFAAIVFIRLTVVAGYVPIQILPFVTLCFTSNLSGTHFSVTNKSNIGSLLGTVYQFRPEL